MRNHAAPLSFEAILGCRTQVVFVFRTLARSNLEGAHLGNGDIRIPAEI
jgi:hypothetical protein